MSPGRRDNRPVVAIVNDRHGLPTEVWVRRHAAGLRRFRALLIARRPLLPGALEPLAQVVLLPGSGARTAAALLDRIAGWTRQGRERRLRGAIVEHDVRLAHVHFLWNAIWFFRELPRSSLPIVVTAHGTDVNQALVDEGYRRRMIAAARRAERVLCVSEFVRERLVSLGCPEQRLAVHYLGAPRPLDAGRGAGDGLRFVCVAGLRPEKGHLHLIRAFADVAVRVPGTELTLVGEGEMRDAIVALVAERGLTGRVRLLGVRTEAEVFAELARSDIYVQHSVVHRTERVVKEEGLPISLVEAASVGLPLVATEVGGVPEICRPGVNGLLSPPGDSAAMARNMLRLATDPGLRLTLGERGRALVAASFDQDRQLQGLEALYEGILGAGDR